MSGTCALSFSVTNVACERIGSSVTPQILLRLEVSDLKASTGNAKGAQTMHLKEYSGVVKLPSFLSRTDGRQKKVSLL